MKLCPNRIPGNITENGSTRKFQMKVPINFNVLTEKELAKKLDEMRRRPLVLVKSRFSPLWCILAKCVHLVVGLNDIDH